MTIRRCLPGLLVVSLMMGSMVATAGESSAAGLPKAAASSVSATVWLCRPGAAANPCATSLSTTAVAANGSRSLVHRTVSASARSVDCFYVYPTVSKELSTNADLKVGKAEIDVAEAQAAPFSQDCEVWAPIYRQRTLLSLAGGLGSDPQANAIAYKSVLSAWKDFLANDSDGRPFVLIGHSQGAAMLILLIKNEIDPNPSVRARLVSAIVLGGNVQVPDGKDVGGSFDHVPGCGSATETGCVIAYSSFPATPPSDSLFGRPGTGVSLQSAQTDSSGQHVLCTNPAALSGGAGVLDPEFPTATVTLSGTAVNTPWVEFPNRYMARCQSSGGATWLDVSTSGGASDTRPVVTESDGPAWGYHGDDVGLALANLVRDVATEEAAYRPGTNG